MTASRRCQLPLAEESPNAYTGRRAFQPDAICPSGRSLRPLALRAFSRGIASCGLRGLATTLTRCRHPSMKRRSIVKLHLSLSKPRCGMGAGAKPGGLLFAFIGEPFGSPRSMSFASTGSRSLSDDHARVTGDDALTPPARGFASCRRADLRRGEFRHIKRRPVAPDGIQDAT